MAVDTLCFPGGVLNYLDYLSFEEGFFMSNRVTVTIDGREYNIIAAEDEAYVRKVAAHVDEQAKAVIQSSRVSSVDGITLAAMNIADQYYKEQAASENLRRQLKEYLEEGAKQKLEISELKREIFKLQNQKT